MSKRGTPLSFVNQQVISSSNIPFKDVIKIGNHSYDKLFKTQLNYGKGEATFENYIRKENVPQFVKQAAKSEYLKYGEGIIEAQQNQLYQEDRMRNIGFSNTNNVMHVNPYSVNDYIKTKQNEEQAIKIGEQPVKKDPIKLQSNATNEFVEDFNYTKMSNKNLRTKLKFEGKKTSGNKKDLIKRIAGTNEASTDPMTQPPSPVLEQIPMKAIFEDLRQCHLRRWRQSDCYGLYRRSRHP